MQGRGPSPPLFLDQTEARRAEKVLFLRPPPPPPYLRVWKAAPAPSPLITRSGSAILVYAHHLRDRRGAALLRYRNRNENFVLMCERTLSGIVYVPVQKLSGVSKHSLNFTFNQQGEGKSTNEYFSCFCLVNQ